jgi:TolB-like protein/tRNA A-37 threonylcarbamoyl transferase component Bud32
MPLTPATRLGPYEVIAPLGAGAMGEVYRARDTRLGREVAIKVLSAVAIDDADARRRFRGEGVALCRLSHPNVAAVFDVGNEEGTDFLVMELIPGASLAERLSEGPTPEAEVLPLSLQLAEGMAAAHEGGIIHRDLKPANIRVTPEGRLKVVDFGLALELEPSATLESMATMTLPGQVAGTLAYMAPEVLSGARADTRSDVFSLGVVLYELATGRHPFPGESVIERLNAIANRAAAPPRTLRPELPEGLDAVILHAMHREPSQRPASAGDVLAALRAVAAGGAPRPARKAPSRSARSRIRSLVVLPLGNLSGDPAQDFFADGMTEALIADLAKIDGLRVISRTSAMRYKGARRPLPEIGAELGVDAVVEGSVARVGGRVRITAQLVHAASDTHLWADSYDRDLSDVLSLQSEAARAIAAEIRIKLSPRSKARLEGARRVNPEAYEAYLRGRHHLTRRTEEALLNAADYFRNAIDLDPTYTLAHVGLADVHNLLGYWSYRAPLETFPRGKAAARRALELDPDAGEAHISLAYALHYHDWDWEGAAREYRRGIELNPTYPQGHLWKLNLHTARKEFAEALREVDHSIELDPLSVVCAASKGWVLYFMRDFDAAIDVGRKALELDRHSGPAHLWLSWPHVAKGQFDDAFRELDAARESLGDAALLQLTLANAHACAGDHARARDILGRVLGQRGQRHVPADFVAMAFMALGEPETAWEWLERAVGERAHWLVFLQAEPRFDGFRGDPRFEELRRRVGI